VSFLDDYVSQVDVVLRLEFDLSPRVEPFKDLNCYSYVCEIRPVDVELHHPLPFAVILDSGSVDCILNSCQPAFNEQTVVRQQCQPIKRRSLAEVEQDQYAYD
jgi:hypothetical protein